jgi:hypothetical protein
MAHKAVLGRKTTASSARYGKSELVVAVFLHSHVASAGDPMISGTNERERERESKRETGNELQEV